MLVECALPFQPLRLQQKQWLRADVFSGTTTDTLSQLQSGQLHPEMRQWQVFSKRPGEIAQILSVEVRQWLLAHPHLHIEWSNGILLLYRPRHLLDEHSIEPAINAGCELAQLLQNNASTIQ